MTDQSLPSPPTFIPLWLAPESVANWLHQAWAPPGGPEDVDRKLLIECAAAAEPYAQRCRPEWKTASGAYIPDAETYHGAVMYAAREYRRRNSPAGIEVYGEGASFVSRFDPDIDRCLRTGAWAPPATA